MHTRGDNIERVKRILCFSFCMKKIKRIIWRW